MRNIAIGVASSGAGLHERDSHGCSCLSTKSPKRCLDYVTPTLTVWQVHNPDFFPIAISASETAFEKQADYCSLMIEASVVASPRPLGDQIIQNWMLDPAIAFLNHGCFGARLRSVAEIQQRHRDRFEASPVQVLHFDRDEAIQRAKESVGRFIGASPANFGFVTNATAGVNVVLRALSFQPGDELLTINHVYNAVRMAMHMVGDRCGATPIEARLPLPIASPREVVDVVHRAITKRTRLLIIDHITSPTALVLPVHEIVALCNQHGVDVLIDGAHAPGMVELDVESIGAAYYAGNLHKWTCAPVGAGFLWARPDRQNGLHPLTISHFLEEGFPHEFRWQGTRDITPWLTVPAAIEFMEKQYGWAAVRRHNHQMAVWAHTMLCEKWDVEPISPLDGSMLGSMATLRLPDVAGLQRKYETPEALQRELFERHRFEVPIVDWDGTWWLRVSCQVYNTADQYERLGDAVLELA